jgi:hypothetical protein
LAFAKPFGGCLSCTYAEGKDFILSLLPKKKHPTAIGTTTLLININKAHCKNEKINFIEVTPSNIKTILS